MILTQLEILNEQVQLTSTISRLDERLRLAMPAIL